MIPACLLVRAQLSTNQCFSPMCSTLCVSITGRLKVNEGLDSSRIAQGYAHTLMVRLLR